MNPISWRAEFSRIDGADGSRLRQGRMPAAQRKTAAEAAEIRNANIFVQLNPPNSQISKMIGSGMPISQSNKPRPIVASSAFVWRKNARRAR
jgi:hypothetical protein